MKQTVLFNFRNMADNKPTQEGAFNSPRKCLTSRGRQEIAYPPSLQRIQMSIVYTGHETRPPERNNVAREGFSGATFDFTSMTNEVLSIDFVSWAAQPTDHPATTLYDGNAAERHRNDSSPHLDDLQGNPTAHATPTTALDQPATALYDGNAAERHRNDSSPHLDDLQGNPTAHATPTTALDQPATALYDGNAAERHRNDSSPHLDDLQGNPTAHATSTTAFERQQIYNRPVNCRYSEMAAYSARLGTFRDWPLNHGPPIEDLVRADMFYQGKFYYYFF